jgi:hypothetical protein
VQAATNFCFRFDFDEWSQLAKDDPFAFEARRIALIEAYLRQFPQSGQRRLRGPVPHRMERRRARTPMAACLKISSMMWESLLGRHGLKTALDTSLPQPVSHCPLRHAPIPVPHHPLESPHADQYFRWTARCARVLEFLPSRHPRECTYPMGGAAQHHRHRCAHGLCPN